jgi:hypothetical protein
MMGAYGPYNLDGSATYNALHVLGPVWKPMDSKNLNKNNLIIPESLPNSIGF